MPGKWRQCPICNISQPNYFEKNDLRFDRKRKNLSRKFAKIGQTSNRVFVIEIFTQMALSSLSRHLRVKMSPPGNRSATKNFAAWFFALVLAYFRFSRFTKQRFRRFKVASSIIFGEISASLKCDTIRNVVFVKNHLKMGQNGSNSFTMASRWGHLKVAPPTP